jgi:hypothetical protein
MRIQGRGSCQEGHEFLPTFTVGSALRDSKHIKSLRAEALTQDLHLDIEDIYSVSRWSRLTVSFSLVTLTSDPLMYSL